MAFATRSQVQQSNIPAAALASLEQTFGTKAELERLKEPCERTYRAKAAALAAEIHQASNQDNAVSFLDEADAFLKEVSQLKQKHRAEREAWEERRDRFNDRYCREVESLQAHLTPQVRSRSVVT